MKKIIKIILIVAAIILLLIILGIIFDKKEGPSEVIEGEGRIISIPFTSKILFASNRDTGSRRTEIYAMDADGKNQTRITFTNEHHFIIGIDGSHRYIVTSRAEKDTDKPDGLGDEDKRSLWLIDLEEKREVRLTNLDNHAEGDSFSPDGEWIVFLMKVKGEEQSDIYKIKKDATGLTKLTNTKAVIEGDPEWSHSGEEIVFTSLDADTNRFLIKKMNSDGKNIETVYDGGGGVAIGPFPPGNYDPSFSPDDEWIVFERAISAGGNWGSGVWHIFKVKRDGSGLVDLSVKGNHANRAEFLPSYSPDGKSIVFGSYYEAENPFESHNDIFKMNSETGKIIRLTDNPASDVYPVWIK